MGSNGDLVKGLYEAFGTGDVPAVLGAMDEQIEWQEPEFSPYQTQVGPLNVAENVFGKVVSDFPDFTAVPHEIVDSGDVVVALGTYRGTAATTGNELNVTFAHVWHIEGGKVKTFRTYNDSLGWLKALGKA